jgi:hypothetical protein
MLQQKHCAILTAAATGVIVMSAAVAAQQVDDRSYLPPQAAQSKTKPQGEQAAPQVADPDHKVRASRHPRHQGRNASRDDGFFSGIFGLSD